MENFVEPVKGGSIMKISTKLFCLFMVMFFFIFSVFYSTAFSGSTTVTTTGIEFPDGTTQTTAYTGGGGSSVWSTSGSNVYYNAGNVGIGTSNPGAQLQIGNDDTEVRIGGAGSTSGGGHVIDFYSSGTAVGRIEITDTDYSTALLFWTYSASTLSERMTIDGTGNVGIGTTNPGQRLSVAGTIESTSGGIKFPDGTTQTTAATGGGSSVWSTSGSNVYYDSGNVGIGTTAPDNLLSLEGNSNEALGLHLTNSDPGALAFSIARIGTDIPGMKYGALFMNSAANDQYGGPESFNIIHVPAKPLTLGTANQVWMTIDGTGNVGIGATNPDYPLEMGSGAHVTTGGVWTNASSREYKENIRDLSYEEAVLALSSLNPSKFNYKVDRDDEHLGFIAEDVPELVATKDRKGLSSMDIVAVLTKVVQQQQKRIEALEAIIRKKQ